MTRTARIVSAAACIALAVVLPLILHTVPSAGKIFLPMHLPVLLCGLVCGPLLGLACGAISPAISYFVSGMPVAAALPGMICELAVYGLVSGLLFKLLRRAPAAARVYGALIGAMLCGRIVAGLVNGFIFQSGKYTMQAWLAASFTTALPGIAIQLVVIPLVLFILHKAKVVDLTPARQG